VTGNHVALRALLPALLGTVFAACDGPVAEPQAASSAEPQAASSAEPAAQSLAEPAAQSQAEPADEEPRSPLEEEALRITGAVSKPLTLDPITLARRFERQVEIVEQVNQEGKNQRLRAIPLRAVVEASAPAFKEGRERPDLAFAVVARSRDGTCVAYSYHEVAPREGKSDLMLAFAEEEGPLPKAHAPVRILSVGKGDNARALHSVVEIKLFDLAESWNSER
jgi:hypothetical protein